MSDKLLASIPDDNPIPVQTLLNSNPEMTARAVVDAIDAWAKQGLVVSRLVRSESHVRRRTGRELEEELNVRSGKQVDFLAEPS